ncbi:MAG: hypothetical protein G3M70_03815 [Candidatus Nitronauta litoralis]|uniref:Uncharacterized protein n=1 Tax=Candidatus Nitronauta litoralis TaxID=2705533 RepID=A0A7T0BUI9_9BACT|nr:MAG: hypothetical protein G3M70_03815 [Candidatus Nitronauta litoralis]
MQKPIIIFLLPFLFLTVAHSASAEDIFTRKRPDPGIAMIHFPQSLAVVQVVNSIEGFDKGLLKLWFRKMDPARIVPVKISENIQGEIDREKLITLGNRYKTDLLLIFQSSSAGENFITRGLVYFVKQKKVHPLRNISVVNTSVASEKIQVYRASLKHIVFQTRKIIHSYKFEKRRSNY